MTVRGIHTQNEILGQVTAWQSALDEIEAKREALRAFGTEAQFSDIIFTGCGSTYYLSLVAASLFQEHTVWSARAAPASELLLFPDMVLPSARGRTLLVTISRSGATTETLRAAQAFKKRQGPSVVAISCDEDSPLVTESIMALIAGEAKEQSIAQTRSFSSMLILTQAWAWLLDNERHLQALGSLPAVGDRLISENCDLAKQLGEDSDLERFFFLGSGPRYGLACEAMLKMKEMSLSYSEAFHFMEFRHGPMSMVNDATLVVGLLSDTALDYEAAVLEEMRALGARTLVLAEDKGKKPLPADYLVCFESGLPESVRGVLYMPVLQLLAYHRAMCKGLNPDTPEHLSAVVML